MRRRETAAEGVWTSGAEEEGSNKRGATTARLPLAITTTMRTASLLSASPVDSVQREQPFKERHVEPRGNVCQNS